jgi:hypothetical protein
MQVSTPSRDNRRPAQAQTGDTPNSKRGRQQHAEASSNEPNNRNQEKATTTTGQQATTHPTVQEQDNESNSIEREQLSIQSNTSNEASVNTAPDGRIVITEHGFTYVNSRNSPRRLQQSRPLENNGGRGGRGFGGGNLNGPTRRYRRAVHPLVTGVTRITRIPTTPGNSSTTTEHNEIIPKPARLPNNGVYQGGYYAALAEYDDEDAEVETNTQEEETTIASEYASQPGNQVHDNQGRSRRVPTSLQEALRLLNSYKNLPNEADADPAGGRPNPL